MSELKPDFTFELGGAPDWMVLTADAVWISNDKLSAVQRIDSKTNQVVAKIEFPAPPCSGLADGFGSVWVPLAGTPRALARVDPATNRVNATLPFGTADDEGGITASEDSIWIVSDKQGTLVRIDPATNTIRQKISLAPGSFNPMYSDGIIWVTGNESGVLTAVDAASGKILAVIPVGPHPRFLTAGAGSIWTLNQGDGSVTRVDAKLRRVTATIDAHSPGHGGEICFGAGSVWTTVSKVPLTRIEAESGRVIGQWIGAGGDSVRFGHGSIWLTDIRNGHLWRIPLKVVGGLTGP
jgi:streptogramin lyase